MFDSVNDTHLSKTPRCCNAGAKLVAHVHQAWWPLQLAHVYGINRSTAAKCWQARCFVAAPARLRTRCWPQHGRSAATAVPHRVPPRAERCCARARPRLGPPNPGSQSMMSAWQGLDMQGKGYAGLMLQGVGDDKQAQHRNQHPNDGSHVKGRHLSVLTSDESRGRVCAGCSVGRPGRGESCQHSAQGAGTDRSIKKAPSRLDSARCELRLVT